MLKKGMGRRLKRLLSGFGFLLASTAAHAQGGLVDFQALHLRPPQNRAEERFIAIHTLKDLSALWGDSNPNPKPAIDFDHYTLLIANLGARPNSGYEVLFESIRIFPYSKPNSQSSLVTFVSVLEIGSGNCPTFQAITYPVAFALIPKDSNEIRFSKTYADRDCNVPRPPPAPPFVK
jgi:hypothetical protein